MVQALPSGGGIDFAAMFRRWTEGRPKGNERDAVRMLFLALNITGLRAPGAFAELGVWRGHSARLMHDLAPERTLYLFDTFEGFDRRDVTDPTHLAHFRDTSVAQVRAFLGDPANLLIISGRFPDAAHLVPDGERFAFVHLDCDLPGPTRAALAFFYPRLSPGGIIVVHDYNSGRWPGLREAVDGFMADKPESLIQAPDRGGSVAFVRMKPI